MSNVCCPEGPPPLPAPHVCSSRVDPPTCPATEQSQQLTWRVHAVHTRPSESKDGFVPPSPLNNLAKQRILEQVNFLQHAEGTARPPCWWGHREPEACGISPQAELQRRPTDPGAGGRHPGNTHLQFRDCLPSPVSSCVSLFSFQRRSSRSHVLAFRLPFLRPPSKWWAAWLCSCSPGGTSAKTAGTLRPGSKCLMAPHALTRLPPLQISQAG